LSPSEKPIREIQGWNIKPGTIPTDIRFEVFTTVTMKNAVFWDIKPEFVPHRRHITSPLQIPPVNAM
jgi:hypothetical protein